MVASIYNPSTGRGQAVGSQIHSYIEGSNLKNKNEGTTLSCMLQVLMYAEHHPRYFLISYMISFAVKNF